MQGKAGHTRPPSPKSPAPPIEAGAGPAPAVLGADEADALAADVDALYNTEMSTHLYTSKLLHRGEQMVSAHMHAVCLHAMGLHA